MVIKIPFNPIERAEKVEKIVMRDCKRKYYRFRFARYYGGIVTADACGCCFLCAYCWNYFRNLHPEKCGKFYSVEEVVEKLKTISERKNCNKFRISGAEPILGKQSFEHLIKIIENFEGTEFILETNGLILGYYPEFIKKLGKFKDFLFVRISIKGWDEKSFEKVTGAKGRYWIYSLKALKLLIEFGFNAWPAVMWEIFGSKGVEALSRKLESFGINTEVELEYLEVYSFVRENLKKRGFGIIS